MVWQDRKCIVVNPEIGFFPDRWGGNFRMRHVYRPMFCVEDPTERNQRHFPFSFEVDLLRREPPASARRAPTRVPLAFRRSRCDNRAIGGPPKTTFARAGERAEIGRLSPLHRTWPLHDGLNLAGSSTCHSNQATNSVRMKSWRLSARAGWAKCTRRATRGSTVWSPSRPRRKTHHCVDVDLANHNAYDVRLSSQG